MKKICFVTTISGTIRSFILKTAIYLHENTDWDISFICSYDSEFEKELPEYIHYYPVTMERGISIGGIKAMFEMKKIFKKEKFDMEGRILSFCCGTAGFWRDLCGNPHRGADPESGQCTAS